MKNGIFVALVALAGCVCAAEEFSWDGTSPDSEFKFSEKRFEVVPGSTVCFDIGWTKKEWNFFVQNLLKLMMFKNGLCIKLMKLLTLFVRTLINMM